MNKYGIFYVYWTKNWEVDISELLQYLSKADEIGFDILELHTNVLENLSEADKQRLKDEAEKKSMHFTFCTSLTEETDISSDDEEVRERGKQFLRDKIETVSEMNGDTLSGLIQGAWNKSVDLSKVDKDAYIERSTSAMKDVIETAEDLDVLCNIEVVNRFEQFMINTCEEALDYVERVDSPNLKIHLDTYHMNIEEDNIRKAIVNAGENLGHFHIGENNRKPPGQGGHIQWDDVVRGLSDIDYSRYIVMEPFLLTGGNVANDVKLSRDLSEGLDLDEEARKGLEFFKRKLEE